jgi:hypothetical protein
MPSRTRTLAELEAELDPAEFFRVNRPCLVAAPAVKGFRSLVKGKLLVDLEPAPAVKGFRSLVKGKLLVDLEPSPAGDVVVSQEMAARFRAWLAG